MLLHVSDEAGQVLYCPVCERELLPAYWTEDGLEVAYWYELEPEEGQAGLLVCGDFDCTYEEPVTFAVNATADAVVLSLEETLMQFGGYLDSSITAADALKVAADLEEAYVATARAKLKAAAVYFQELAENHQEYIERWLEEAARGYPVSLQLDDGKIEGQVVTSSADEFVLQMADGQLRVVKKNEAYAPHIHYPRKPRKTWEQSHIYFILSAQRIVVNGYHLDYGETNDFGQHLGSTKDPAVAAVLGLSEVSAGLWRGVFLAEEIERYYWEREWVLIKGHWLELVGRSKDDYLWVRSKDPEAAKSLDLGPQYAMEANEFGARDGELVGYEGSFPAALIEATRSDEEVEPLPKRW